MRPRLVPLLLVPLLLVAAGCRTGQVLWGPCVADTDPWGTDGTWVLVCRGGEWRPTMTVGEFVALRRGQRPPFSPLPTRPVPTTTTAPATTTTASPTTSTTAATSTTTTTTTTTVPGPPTAPVVNGLNPAEGAVAGGDTVLIAGQGFLGTTSVTFGGSAATSVTVVSDSFLSVVTPPHAAGTVDVVVTDDEGSGSAGGFEYLAPPTVTSVAPSSGPVAGGTTVVIGGVGLAHVGSVDFGPNAATSFVVDSDSQITAVAPEGVAGEVDVRVTSWGGTSDVTTADRFTYT